MKGNKVLFGLFASLSMLFSVPASAQVNTGNKLVELGPDNIAGRVTSVVVDMSDASHQTLYAGAATGGLFVRSTDSERAPYANMWNKVTCVVDGEETTLPISHMVQGPDNIIYIATGEGCFEKSNKFSELSVMGRGIFRFNPTTGELTRIPNTVPTDLNSGFASVNKLAVMVRNGVLYLFAATNMGLYRWDIASEADWETAPICYQPMEHIYDVVTIEPSNMVYFSTFGGLWRISNVSGHVEPVDIYNNLPATDVPCISRLAVSPTDPSYVYVMRIRNNGMLDGVFLSTNHSTWTLITPSSVAPFSTTSGFESGAICVDPINPRRLYIAGSSLYSGEGFLEGALYTWIQNSYNEYQLGPMMGVTNYMANIFSSANFVHSGINQVVSTWQEGSSVPVYYLATDGGVFASYNQLRTFGNINKGLNNLEVNGLAVANDGSLLMGANHNSNVFLEARMAHFGGVGTESWYDAHPELNTNHHGNVIWYGNGGQVAISRFQQYSPNVRRNIFVSSSQGYARASNDYSDYSQTQTWTTGTSFLSATVADPYSVPQMALWESENITEMSDTILMEVDTLGFATRHTADGDTLVQMRPGTELLAGDEITVFARNNAYYPVVYTVPEDFTLDESDTVRVMNPTRSHLFVVGKKVGSLSSMMELYMTWMPSDFRKVWYSHTSSQAESEDEMNEKMQWAKIFALNVSSIDYTVGGMAVTKDGDHLFVAINNLKDNRSMIYRISGMLSNIDYGGTVSSIKGKLTYGGVAYTLDTMRVNGTTQFTRCISSLTVDPNNDDHLVVTFQGYGAGSNIVDVRDATKAHPILINKTVADNIPAYSAMIETTTGEVYIGTEDGVWVASAFSYASSSPAWKRYNNMLAGVPVTAMIQQTNTMPVRHAINHIGIIEENYVFPRTKYPYAMYFGTYGRGVFMDSVYVVDHTNEIVDERDYQGINTVSASGLGAVKLYPNPASDQVQVQLSLQSADRVIVRVYDINGHQVLVDNLGYRAAGIVNHTVNTSALARGIYMVYVTTAQGSAASKLVIR